MINWKEKFALALPYDEFLTRYGQPTHAGRWRAVFEQVQLTEEQLRVLGSFKREMPVLCLAGAWCGDCVEQCPILDHFARACDRIKLRFLDRDEHPDVQLELTINAGHRVPVVVFLSEDFCEVARYGDRTLARYRMLASQQFGPACPTGLASPAHEALAATTQDLLDEFDRVQLLLWMSPRLRQKHGDLETSRYVR